MSKLSQNQGGSDCLSLFFVDFRRNDKTIGEQFYSEEKTCDIIIKQLPMHKSTGERRR